MISALTVSQINTYLKSVIDGDARLQHIFVTGEISDFKNHFSSGHFYFTLKDQRSSLKAVMFRSNAQRVTFDVRNGMKVVIRGSISVYEAGGAYQLYCDEMIPDGAGMLALAYEQLKQKLEAEGLFSADRKKPLPYLPQRVGVVTSASGAAIHDIITVLGRRFPYAQIVLCPASVQGEGAAQSIARGIRLLDETPGIDVIIAGRGGGSAEDLWAFNEEAVARAIYACRTPVVSAVGHETDFTIADLVADVRAATPSAAAEIVAPDYRDLLYTVDSVLQKIEDCLLTKITELDDRREKSLRLLEALSPSGKIGTSLDLLSHLISRTDSAIDAFVDRYASMVAAADGNLRALSPLRSLKNGRAAVRFPDGQPVGGAQALTPGDKIKMIFFDGSAECTIDGVSAAERENNE